MGLWYGAVVLVVMVVELLLLQLLLP